MPLEHSLRTLAENITPSDDKRHAIKAHMQARIRPDSLLSAVSSAVPSSSVRLSLKDKILRSIRPELAQNLESLASSTHLAPSSLQTLRNVILSRLQPLQQVPVVHTGFRWAATFAVFLLIIRSMPLILLAPATQAEVGVQLVPSGQNVSVFAGGVWRDVTEPQIITSAVMVRTGSAGATLVLNDDGVLRLAPDTTVKLHDIGDRPQLHADGPTATLLRGKVWAFGLLPPIVEGLTLETSYGTMSINAGSVSIADDGKGSVTVAVYDRGITLENSEQTSFLVSGEKTVLKERKAFGIQSMPVSSFSDGWVKNNLSQDAVHRSDIAKLQEARRTEVAGILPTSSLYLAKRFAEEVDVLFTLTHDGRTEKRIAQANTRLNEALSLIQEGQGSEAASAPLAEYKDSLVALAADDNDNLVKYLIQKQIADASASLTTASENPDASIQLLKDAVSHIGAAIPNADLKPRDIEGYVLVDKLMMINNILSKGEDMTLAVSEYAEISPYIEGLLADEGGTHPLLKKEANSLLVSTSALLKDAENTGDNVLLIAMKEDVAQFLPAEQTQILVSEEALNAQVMAMMDRIFCKKCAGGPFKHPASRYTELQNVFGDLVSNPDRGTLLRRLKVALPDKLGEYVKTEIQELGGELETQQ